MKIRVVDYSSHDCPDRLCMKSTEWKSGMIMWDVLGTKCMRNENQVLPTVFKFSRALEMMAL